jgi:hypothetical protein
MGIRKWTPTNREPQKREPLLKARRHLNEAEQLHLIARTSGGSIGANGKRGQTIALTLPSGITWDEAIEKFKNDRIPSLVGPCSRLDEQRFAQ